MSLKAEILRRGKFMGIGRRFHAAPDGKFFILSATFAGWETTRMTLRASHL
jgi:hypothetical protein